VLVEIPFSGKFNPTSARDRKSVELLVELIEENPNAFCRSRLDGHVTASAIILNQDRSKILLAHHKKLDVWLHLGGHCDGIKDPFHVAKQEGYEESGLSYLEPITDQILDIDIHEIPSHRGVPAHSHFDVRYAFSTNEEDQLNVSDESNDLKWVPLERLNDYDPDGKMTVIREELMHPPFI
jgi:8-oxo-dGTP pyrophosphatase MutT (NUDIX family)